MTQLKKILHVDDDNDILDLAKMALEEIGGFEVVTCCGWREAVKTAPEFEPDLFLLDVMMPEKTGPETLAELRKRAEFSDTPVIFMTAKIDPDTEAELKSTGAIAIIPKPFDPVTLGEQISKEWTKNVEER